MTYNPAHFIGRCGPAARPSTPSAPFVSTRKVGGLRFLKVGRFTFMACRSKPRPEPKFVMSADNQLVLGYDDEYPSCLRRADARAITTRENRQLATILALAAGVVAIMLFATYLQMRSITIPALQEDGCELFHGSYAISEVVRTDPSSDHVNCIYR